MEMPGCGARRREHLHWLALLQVRHHCRAAAGDGIAVLEGARRHGTWMVLLVLGSSTGNGERGRIGEEGRKVL